ncbi:MAG: hypothetical protein ACI310_02515 [Bacilli bacterium]
MRKKKHILMERYLYLEEWLKDNYPSDMTDGEVLSYFMNNFTNEHDILYLIEAYCLPIEDFSIEIKKSVSGGILSFSLSTLLATLSNKYSISQTKAFNRVKQILDIVKVKSEKSKVNGVRKKLTKCKK